jgi:hypothetical protein
VRSWKVLDWELRVVPVRRIIMGFAEDFVKAANVKLGKKDQLLFK